MDYAEKAAEYALQDNDLAIKYLAKAIGELQKQVAQQRTTESKRQWVGLTDEDIYFVYMTAQPAIANETVKRVARAIEAKLKEKNT